MVCDDVFIFQQRINSSKANAELIELIVSGIVHLVATNPQNAVRLNIYRAFHPDIELRILFIVIMARALRQGIKPPAASVTENYLRKQKLFEVSYPFLRMTAQLTLA
jgi:hypothetical protein